VPPRPDGRREAATPAVEVDPASCLRFDPSRLDMVRSLRSAGPELAERVVGLFLETVPGILVKLRQAASSGDATEIGRAAHSLRGSSRELGALRLAQRCEEIEHLARAGKAGDAASILPALESEYEQVRPLLLEQIQPGLPAEARRA
jgi:HPt (histidine-containing phosphotransfer) domain-containing protein